MKIPRIEAFFASELYCGLMKNAKVRREFKFSVLVPASRYFPAAESEPEENVLLQGVIDCLIETEDGYVILDFKTDREVRDALAREAKDSTKLIVAQRIGTIMNADRIVVLDDGKVVGQGTHKELLDNCDVYRQIAESQLSQSELTA